MTEYDFSPAAYERAREKHESVSRWVDSTKLHETPNPFLPLPGEQRTSSFYNAPSVPRASRSTTPYAPGFNYGATPSRSYSLPPPMATRTLTAQSYTPPQYTSYSNGTYFSYPNSHHTSPVVSPPAPTQYSYSQTQTLPNGQQYYQPAASQPLIVPIHGGTGGYVVVPAAGQKIQIVPNTQYAPVMTVKSDNGQSFLGSLRSGKKSKKKSRNSRRDSY
ncbi:hypothetical protein CVT24_004174 [Panaeolus cyanescens]|uniref:Uncharacterized protein n=1 Tax=Panaeolus cyanescens TaxID=181874 RepID=A0A409W7Y8_9AGAR|nr:hypothetical protein CVT24_004174 [Panaeolus cyanescens]